MNWSILLASSLLLFSAGCGSNGQEEAEKFRQAELQELSEEMEGVLLRLDQLKVQLRDSIDDQSATADSSRLVRADQYRLMLSELEAAEAAYESWKEEITFEPEGMKHEDAMQFYEIEEEKAATIRMDIRQTIQRVESEIQQN